MARGKLRIYLGAAPGVGKTFAMLSEGRRAKARGTDAVVGLFETHGRPQTAAQVGDLEVIPRKTIEYRGKTFEALRRRMAHGNIYPLERIDASLANYFRPGNLAALRELALLWVADRVEDSLQQYLEDHGIEGTWETRERVVVALTGAPGGDVLIRRAARMARRAKGDLIGVHVRPTDGLAQRSSELLAK